MTFLKRICNFFQSFFKNTFSKVFTKRKEEEEQYDLFYQKPEEEQDMEKMEEEKINVARRTLLTRLYTLEQEIVVFEADFPAEYQNFLRRIENLRKAYNDSLEELEKLLRFEIDPEMDSTKIGAVARLEQEVKAFLENEFQFNIISKKLQKLIRKLNILYNVAICHSEESEKQKVQSQIEKAIEAEKKIIEQAKSCHYIWANTQCKERIVSLISYVDYMIFKTSIRVTNFSIEDVLQRLVMQLEFEDFDYEKVFEAFLKDELSDLMELIPLVEKREFKNALNQKANKLMKEVASQEKFLESNTIWKNFISFESILLEVLKASGVEKEKAKVKLLERMEIDITEGEVLTAPITVTYLSLTELFSTTHDVRIYLLLELLKKVSQKITYKEVYFLAELFEAIRIIQNSQSELFSHLEKYITQYSYDKEKIARKKRAVKRKTPKEYVACFTLGNYTPEVLQALEKLNIDFKQEDEKILLNSFYFNGMDDVLPNLKTTY